MPLLRPTTRHSNGQWAFAGSRHKLTGPHNPNLVGQQPGKNKPAFLSVTRNATIRLTYQGSDGARWLECQSELDTVSISSDVLTHASLCAEKGWTVQSLNGNIVDVMAQMRQYWLPLILSPSRSEPTGFESIGQHKTLP